MGSALHCFRRATNKQADIEERDITKKTKRIIPTGREQDRRKKTAGYPENGHHDRIQSHGEQERHRCDQRHQEEGRNQSEQREMVIRPAGESNGVKNQNSSRTKCLRCNHVLLPLER